MKAIAGFLCIVVVGLYPFLASADSATSTNFILERGVIDSGGGLATSTSFSGQSSIGQPGTGISTSTSYILRGGFLNFDNAVASTSTPPPPTVIVGIAPRFGPPGPISPEEIIRRCDFNDDGRCNLVDLSIMLFYYDLIGPTIARYDLNINNRVDFPDVSVLMYYWTG